MAIRAQDAALVEFRQDLILPRIRADDSRDCMFLRVAEDVVELEWCDQRIEAAVLAFSA